MSILDLGIREWSTSTKGAADNIQKFGETNQDYGDAILRTMNGISNLFLEKKLVDIWATVPLEFHGATTLLRELQDYTNNAVTEWISGTKDSNDLIIDIFSNLTERNLSSNGLQEFRAQLNQLATHNKVDSTLNEAVVIGFKSHPSVKSIVTEIYNSETIFSIYFVSPVYDDRLMDSLLDIEVKLLETFPTQLFSFNYIPIKSEQQFVDHLVPSRGKLLFKG